MALPGPVDWAAVRGACVLGEAAVGGLAGGFSWRVGAERRPYAPRRHASSPPRDARKRP